MSFIFIIISAIVIAFLLLLMTSINYVFRSQIEIKIGAPVSFTFPRVFDEAFMKQWFSSPQLQFVGMENVRGHRNQVGSQWKLIYVSRKGTRMEMLETITAYRENEFYAFDLQDPYFNFHVDMHFEKDNGDTIIRESIKGKSPNHFFNAMMRVFSGKSKRVKEEQYQKLKSLIERAYQKTDEEE